MSRAHVDAICEAAMREFGMPETTRTDNGAPFATPGALGLSKLSARWIRLGIVHERIEPGCPQQGGQHERMHRTLKEDTATAPAFSLQEQQQRFDRVPSLLQLRTLTRSARLCNAGVSLRCECKELACGRCLRSRKMTRSWFVACALAAASSRQATECSSVRCSEVKSGDLKDFSGTLRIGTINPQTVTFTAAVRD